MPSRLMRSHYPPALKLANGTVRTSISWPISQPVRRNLAPQDRAKRYAMYDIGSVLDLSSIPVADTQAWSSTPMIMVTPPTPLPLGTKPSVPEVPELDSPTASSSDEGTQPPDVPLSAASEEPSIKPCTPAEYIVNCFRAGMNLEAIQSSTAVMESKNREDLVDEFDWVSSVDSDSLATFDSEFDPASEPSDVAAFRIVDYGGLAEARNEAYLIMTAANLGEQDAIACRRPDCGDVLPDVKALIYHLHIHNLHDERYKCHNCDGLFHHRWQLSMHTCPVLSTPPPTSPIKSVFNILRRCHM